MPPGSGEFTIETSHSPGEPCLVALHGELDVAGLPVLSTALATLSNITEGVIVDLSDLSFIDSTGISALIIAAREIQARGGVMTLRAPQVDVRRLFDIVRLGDLLPIEN